MRCPKCKQDKTPNDFHRNKSRVTGLSHYCKSCKQTMDKQHYVEHSADLKDKEIARGANIDVDTYRQLKTLYGDCCNICGATENIRGWALAYDHDHTTGEFRGFLCTNCNKGLGHFKDNPDLLERAIKYLQRR